MQELAGAGTRALSASRPEGGQELAPSHVRALPSFPTLAPEGEREKENKRNINQENKKNKKNKKKSKKEVG